MKKEKKDNHFIKKPYYKGGISALKAFVKQNLRYPEAAKNKKIEGTVHIRYSINYKGIVVDAKIISGLGFGCDEEAKRLVKLLQYEVPKNRNLKILFHKTIQIHFRLPKTIPARDNKIQYIYTSTDKKESSKNKEKGGSYDITISF